MTSSPFVTTEWLADHLGDPDVVVVDCSWHMPSTGRNAETEYLDNHIPGAVFFDIDAVSDKSSGLPHMLPDAGTFAAAVGPMGISEDMTIVVYDQVGMWTAPRGWWTFSVFGARDVRVLEGGTPQWRAEKRPLESGLVFREARTFRPDFKPELVRGFDAVKAASLQGSAQIVDARSAERFRGAAPEPREGLRGGHIPGSTSMPVATVTEGGKLRPVPELKMLFDVAGLDLKKPIVTSCGSGVTAATLALALHAAGAGDVAVYDGSWSEWGMRLDAPVER